jgi:photosystem II stability/assembly factor-like uncharacterized protein
MERKMRALKISLLVFILSITISAQWYQQNSGSNNYFYGVYSIDSLTSISVGEHGTILKTTNGGEDWTVQVSGTTENLLGIFFIDNNKGIVVGYNGTILKTTDAGITWNQVTSGIIEALIKVYFSDSYKGTAVGIGGTIIRTTDGGTSWFLQQSGTINALFGITFIDANTGIAVGSYGTILKTTNGGSTWVPQFSGTNYYLADISHIDSNTLMIVGENGLILKTTNGGLTWNFQTSGTTNLLQSISLIDSNYGTVVGYQGTILRTYNGGIDWISQTSGTEKDLNAVFFINMNNGIAVGDSGTILKTNNGGIPVALISFTAEVFESEIKFNWSTATETNNSGFEILRFAQNDNNEWEDIGFVPGHGTTTETQHYSFTDNDLKPGKYQYKLKQIDYDGTFEYSQIVEADIPFANEFLLSQNYPNPFNPTTKIEFRIADFGFVNLKVYDILGREVAILVNEEKPAGEYEIEFNAANLPSGIYFYQLKAGQFSQTKKMILLK